MWFVVDVKQVDVHVNVEFYALAVAVNAASTTICQTVAKRTTVLI